MEKGFLKTLQSFIPFSGAVADCYFMVSLSNSEPQSIPK